MMEFTIIPFLLLIFWMLYLNKEKQKATIDKVTLKEKKENMKNKIVNYLKKEGYKGEYNINDKGQLYREYKDSSIDWTNWVMFISIVVCGFLLFSLLEDMFIDRFFGWQYSNLKISSIDIPKTSIKIPYLPLKIFIIGMFSLLALFWDRLRPNKTGWFDIYLNERKNKTILEVQYSDIGDIENKVINLFFNKNVNKR